MASRGLAYSAQGGHPMRHLLPSWLRPPPPSTRVLPHCRLEVETLEGRSLPSISSPLPTLAQPGPVTITGTNRPDQLLVRLQPGSPANVQFSDDGGATFQTAPLAAVTQVIV